MFPLPVGDFGGLNLRDAVDEVAFSGAIDLLNVDFSTPGVLASRPGYATSNSGSPATDRYQAVIGTPRNAWTIASRRGATTTTLSAFQANGAAYVESATQSIASIAGGNAPLVAVEFGTTGANNDWIYVLDPTGTGTPYRLKTLGVLAFDQPAFSGGEAPDSRALALAVTPWDNRLVVGGALNDSSRLKFSNAGDPLTFPTNNFIVLGPNREYITAIATWQNYMIVFTTTAMYTFYGTSTDSSGNPIFNYRRIDVDGGGAINNGCYCTGPDALYFVNRKGLFKTTGDTPVEVGTPIRHLIATNERPGSPGGFYLGNSQIGSTTAMQWVAGHIVIASPLYDPTTFSNLNGGFWLLYNIGTGAWTAWALPHGGDTFALETLGLTARGIIFPNLSGDKGFARMKWRALGFNSTLTGVQSTDDNGTAITSRYQSGFDNLAPPRRFAAHYLFGNTRKRIRKWKVTGTGTVAFNVAHDFAAMPAASSQNVTLGVSPAIADGWYGVAKRGQKFSYRIADVSGAPWSVQSLTSYLAGSEPPLLGNPSDD